MEKYRLSSSTYDTWTLRLDRHWQSSCNPVDCQCRFTTLSFMLYPNFCYSYIGQPTHINRTTVSNDLSLAVIRAELARWMTSDSSFLLNHSAESCSLPNRVLCKYSLQILCKFSANSLPRLLWRIIAAFSRSSTHNPRRPSAGRCRSSRCGHFRRVAPASPPPAWPRGFCCQSPQTRR